MGRACLAPTQLPALLSAGSGHCVNRRDPSCRCLCSVVQVLPAVGSDLWPSLDGRRLEPAVRLASPLDHDDTTTSLPWTAVLLLGRWSFTVKAQTRNAAGTSLARSYRSRSSRVTSSMPPGHANALGQQDCNGSHPTPSRENRATEAPPGLFLRLRSRENPGSCFG